MTFAPVSAELAEKLQEHPGALLEVRLRWREDGLVDFEFTDPNGEQSFNAIR